MECYGRAWPKLQPIARLILTGFPPFERGACTLSLMPLCRLCVYANPWNRPRGKGDPGTPTEKEGAPRRRFGQLGWRLGGKEGALGPWALEFKTAMQRAACGTAAAGWTPARSARRRWRCCAWPPLLAPKASCTCLDQLRVDPLPKETLCTASKEEGSWADDGACVPAAEMPVGSMEYATPAAGSTLAIKRFGPTCQVKQGHLVTSERQPTSSHLLQPQST